MIAFMDIMKSSREVNRLTHFYKYYAILFIKIYVLPIACYFSFLFYLLCHIQRIYKNRKLDQVHIPLDYKPSPNFFFSVLIGFEDRNQTSTTAIAWFPIPLFPNITTIFKQSNLWLTKHPIDISFYTFFLWHLLEIWCWLVLRMCSPISLAIQSKAVFPGSKNNHLAAFAITFASFTSFI